MMKLIPFFLLLLFNSGCINKHGVSAKYYSDCKEYFDYQGYYHKECGEDDIFTYKEAKDATMEMLSDEKPKPKGNVW